MDVFHLHYPISQFFSSTDLLTNYLDFWMSWRRPKKKDICMNPNSSLLIALQQPLLLLLLLVRILVAVLVRILVAVLVRILVAVLVHILVAVLVRILVAVLVLLT